MRRILGCAALIAVLGLCAVPAAAQDAAAPPVEAVETSEAAGAEGAGTEPTEGVRSQVAANARRDVINAIARGRAGDLSGFTTLGEKYVLPALATLLGLLVAYFVAKLLSRWVRTPVERKVDATLGLFLGKLVFYSIMVFALLGVLGKFGLSVASFAAVIAAVGFAIGLAFQGSLSNFAAGVLLLVFRPFKVGDVIKAADLTAKVIEIDLFSTVFDTFDNRRIIVPNSSIASGTIENITFHKERRVDVSVGVAYSADIEETRQTLDAAIQSLKEFLIEGDDRGYQVFLGDLGDSSVQWTLRFWTRSDDFWTVKQKLTQAVKEHLDHAGLGIPFPQMDVHLFRQDP